MGDIFGSVIIMILFRRGSSKKKIMKKENPFEVWYVNNTIHVTLSIYTLKWKKKMFWFETYSKSCMVWCKSISNTKYAQFILVFRLLSAGLQFWVFLVLYVINKVCVTQEFQKLRDSKTKANDWCFKIQNSTHVLFSALKWRKHQSKSNSSHMVQVQAWFLKQNCQNFQEKFWGLRIRTRHWG